MRTKVNVEAWCAVTPYRPYICTCKKVQHCQHKTIKHKITFYTNVASYLWVFGNRFQIETQSKPYLTTSNAHEIKTTLTLLLKGSQLTFQLVGGTWEQPLQLQICIITYEVVRKFGGRFNFLWSIKTSFTHKFWQKEIQVVRNNTSKNVINYHRCKF